VDHRTDVYGLGATLYELLAGRPAFDGDNPADLLPRVVADEPPAPRSLQRSVPAELETVVLGLSPGLYTVYAQATDSDGAVGDPIALTLQVQ
jgi:serine/threonine protein kinase